MVVDLTSIQNKVSYLQAQVLKFGFLTGCRIVLFDFLQKKHFTRKGIFFPDFSNNIDLTISKSIHMDSHENRESSFFALRKAISKIPLSHHQINLLDIGCGSGKLLVVGMRSGFKNVFGIDLDVQSIEKATANCRQMKLVGSSTNFTLKNTDASLFNIPVGTNLIYLFNPFGEKTMRKVVLNIERYFNLHHSELYVIYLNPKYDTLFIDRKIFKKIYSSYFKGSENKEISIYKLAL